MVWGALSTPTLSWPPTARTPQSPAWWTALASSWSPPATTPTSLTTLTSFRCISLKVGSSLSQTCNLQHMFLLSDLISWELKSHVFHSSNWPRWAVDRFYAPEVHVVSGRYILYYTAGDRTGRLSCGAAVATSADPFGKFKVGDTPRVSQAPTVINSGPW